RLGGLDRALAELDRDVLRLAVAQDRHRHRIARVVVVFDPAPQIAARGHGLAVDRDDDVAAGEDLLTPNLHAATARLDAGHLRAGRYLLDQQAFLRRAQAQLLLGLRAQVGQRDTRHADLRVAVAAVLNELGDDAFDDVDGNGEADALV